MAVCLVCAQPISATQLGVNACRACAAFFKRTQLAGRNFICRQGDKKCLVQLKNKFACRSCRYAKCVRIGLNYDNPQRRQPRKRRSILDQVSDAYKESCERRLTAEKNIVQKHKLERLKKSSNYYKSTVCSFWEVFRLLTHESEFLFRKVLSGRVTENYAAEPFPFKSFVSRFNMIENFYLSPLYLTGSNSALSLMQYIDCANVESWLAKRNKEKRREDLESTFRGFARDFADMIVPMRKLKEPVTEREFHALVALAIFDSIADYEEVREEEMWRLRKKVFTELQEYYRTELGLRDFSRRLGNLMTCYYNAAEAGHLQRQEYRMYATMFNVLADDQVLSGIFLT
ncbi:hypothetical protein PRIPAC_82377 [Pristionchus pacificus]|uniref:Nuclear receptor n=1 Tax=Pristionchus pacificus TaxID=54126 RepID=A0A2A6CPV9_PRIPA|nr:hypothetical protein PRIPAC_82377 [Pristionchus pacificus]|eukprot:PDM80245.1 nuclear receptor [Pristionchus pacificus]